MLGAIIGDVIGSRFEFSPRKETTGWELFAPECKFTDDTVMTIAVAEALDLAQGDTKKLPDLAAHCMQQWGRKYPRSGYGGRFREWLWLVKPAPYGSFGNGSAMRVSPVGWAGKDMAETMILSDAVTAVTHNHYQGLIGAQATAGCIYLARTGSSKAQIRAFVEKYFYPLNFTLNKVRPKYRFDVTCQGSVPQSIVAFLEADSFEETIRNAVSLGGDADTQAAIAGGIAEAFWGVPEEFKEAVRPYLKEDMLAVIDRHYPAKAS